MSLPILKFNVNDTKTLKFRLFEADGVTPVDITGLTIRFYAKDEPGDAAYTIDPVEATIPTGTDGRFEFEIVMPATSSDSLYWIEREDAGANIDTFAPAEGTQIQVLEK